MATDLASLRNDVAAFFERCRLPSDTRDRCWALVRELFPGRVIEEVKSQGYCSYTLCVAQDNIVQFRPSVHRLEIRLAEAAREVYGSRAPQTELLGTLAGPHFSSTDSQGRKKYRAPVDEGIAIGDDDEDEQNPGTSLHVYLMTKIPGVSLAELSTAARQFQSSPIQLQQQRETIVEQFAIFIATGWKSALSASDPIVSSLCGKVGSSIRWRLERMKAHLPQRFRSSVREILDRLGEIESLPWALTHGDVVPANVMLQSPRNKTGAWVVNGFLDWAESEYLPCGVGLYGLENFLGETAVDGRFSYYAEAEDIRELFWSRLAAEIPGISIQYGTPYREILEAAHTLGVLLWHGIAFDNGNLRRVVEEGKDDDELWRLDLFLNRTKKVFKAGVGLAGNQQRKPLGDNGAARY